MKKKNTNLTKMDMLVHLLVKVNNDDIFALASQLAYYLALSFFPFIIFLTNLISFTNIDSNAAINGLQSILPQSVWELTSSIVKEVLDSQSQGLLWFSIILAIWTSSSGFRAVIKVINKAYDVDVKEQKSFITITISAYIWTLVLGLTILGALLLLVFGDIIGKYLISVLPFKHIVLIIWDVLRNGLSIVILIFVFASMYKYTVSLKLRWRDVLPGAIVSSIGWVAVSYMFAFYINNFANYSRFYGSLATVFVLMIWLFLTAMIFLFGVEINSVIMKNSTKN